VTSMISLTTYGTSGSAPRSSRCARSSPTRSRRGSGPGDRRAVRDQRAPRARAPQSGAALTGAHLGVVTPLDRFDWSHPRRIDRVLIDRLHTLAFVAAAHGARGMNFASATAAVRRSWAPPRRRDGPRHPRQRAAAGAATRRPHRDRDRDAITTFAPRRSPSRPR
jgi:hypothetical protein